ncbi:hypothetical protein TWF970_000245 [Orbilia oligospora]|uniref:Uncharacterized protein n=1 Tax=Orbilia oligospora TaxID=2813651 RepID=A0A7C8VPA8_ORBOL|nr:hypothetical protein TWF970_000245 [Orbilia oligospora]
MARPRRFIFVLQAFWYLWVTPTYSQSTHTLYYTTHFTSTITGYCSANILPMCENLSWLSISQNISATGGPNTSNANSASGSGGSSPPTGSSSGGLTGSSTGLSSSTGFSSTTTAQPAPSLFFLEGGESFSGYFAVLGEDGNVFLTDVETASGTGFSINSFGKVSTLEEPPQDLLYRRNSTASSRIRRRQDDLIDWGDLLAALPDIATTLGVTERFHFEGKELLLDTGGFTYTLYVQQQNGTYYLMKMARRGSNIPEFLTKLPLTWASTSGTVTLTKPPISTSTNTGGLNPSDILVYDIITSSKLESFCSLLLGYFGTVTSTLNSIASIATKTTTLLETASFPRTETSTIIETSTGSRYTVWIIETATALRSKRMLDNGREIETTVTSYLRRTVTSDNIETPGPLKTFPAAQVRAGCSMAVTAPITSTIITTSITSEPYIESRRSTSTPVVISATTSSTITYNILSTTLHGNGVLRAEITELAPSLRPMIYANRQVNGDTSIPTPGVQLGMFVTRQSWGVSYASNAHRALIITQHLRSGTVMNTYGWHISTSVIANPQSSSVISAYQVSIAVIGSSVVTRRDVNAVEAAPSPVPDGAAAPEPAPVESAGASSSAAASSKAASSPAAAGSSSAAAGSSSAAAGSSSAAAGSSSAAAGSSSAAAGSSSAAQSSSAPTAVGILYMDSSDGYLYPMKNLMSQLDGYENRDTFWVCTNDAAIPRTTLYLYRSTGFAELVARHEPTLTGCSTFHSVLPMVIPATR